MKWLIVCCLPLSCFSLDKTIEPSDPNPSDRFGTKAPYNAYFTGEAVWFKPLNQEVTQQTLSSQNFFTNEFQLGLRLTFGINTNYDKWDVYTSYTALRYSHVNAGYITTNSANTDITIKLNYDVNLADFDLGRCYKISRKLSLRPHLGVRTFWLTQKERLTSLASNQSYVKKILSHFTGLEGGLDTLWKFSSGFSLYGNIGVASLVNAQKVKNKQPSYDFVSTTSTSIIPALDFSLGIKWDINFADNLYHFGFTAGYEQHIYFNINKNYALSSAFSNLASYCLLESPDFSLQGLCVGARFDF